MQFTKAEGYGLLGVLHLATKGKNIVVPLSEVSEVRKIPEKFLAKIFQSLSRTGIVLSHRGIRGGFSLVRDPAEIPVLEVLESIQGPYHLMECTSDSDACDKNSCCAVRDLLIMAETRLVEIFSQHTLADLARWEREKTASPAGA